MFGVAFPFIILGIILFFILCILIPVSVYSAQKWAYKSYKEIVLIRTILQENRSIHIESLSGPSNAKNDL